MKNKIESFDFKTQIEDLNSQIDEKNLIINRTKEYLFVLENQYNIKEKEIEEIKADFKTEISKLNEEKFIFSIVIPIYNTEKYLAEAIDSVINQSFIFDNVEIILVDDGSSDDSRKICEKYVNEYPNNIIYFYQENQGASIARNNGLKMAKGKFVNFLDSDDKLEPQTLNEIYYYFNKFGEEVDVISMPRKYFDRKKSNLSLFEKYDGSRIIDIKEEYDFPITPVSSAFLRKSAASKFEFNPDLIISEDCNFINKLILEKEKFGIVNGVKYLYRKRPEENSLIDTKKADKKYFNPRMEYHYKDLINYSLEKYGKVIKYIQSVLMYELKWFFLNDTDVSVLTDDELEEFFDNIRDVLKVIDDEIILSQEFSKFLKGHLLNIKYDYPNLTIGEDSISFADVSFDKLSDNKVTITKISNKDYGAVLSGYFKFYSNELKLNAKYDCEDLDVIIKKVSEETSMGRVISYKFNFDIKIRSFDDLDKLIFELEFDSNKYPLLIHDKL